MPDAADIVAAADTLAEAGLYSEAVSAYTRAIDSNRSAPQYYVKRSTAYQRTGELDNALKDAEEAVVLAQERGKADLIAAAQMRRGITLHGLKRYADSNFVFELAKKAGTKDKSISIWIAKNTAMLKKLSDEEKETQIDAIPKELPYPVEANPTEAIETKSGEPPKDAPKEDAPPAPAPQIPQRVRHEWYQSDQNVFVDIFFKNIPKDKCTVDFESQAMTVTFPLPSGSDFTFTLDPLAHPIDTEKSTYDVFSTKLTLKLVKSVRAIKWPSLESTGSTTATTTTTAPAPTAHASATPATKGIAYPTSSRKGTKNWDALECEAIKDAEEWEKPEGEAAANALFRDLFKNASPEVRMAMEKSYVESNGTALSTNWEEVSKGRVETRPPDSMVAKKWGE